MFNSFDLTKSSPNWVSSLAKDSRHHVVPFSLAQDDWNKSRAKIIKIVSDNYRAEILRKNGDSLDFTITSSFFRFVDDLCFYFSIEKQQIEVLSASRLGYSDFGVNKKRVEKLRDIYLSSHN